LYHNQQNSGEGRTSAGHGFIIVMKHPHYQLSKGVFLFIIEKYLIYVYHKYGRTVK
jgi:hypothetical protein